MNDPNNKRDNAVGDIGEGVLEVGGEIAAEGIIDSAGEVVGDLIGGIGEVAGEAIGGILDGI